MTKAERIKIRNGMITEIQAELAKWQRAVVGFDEGDWAQRAVNVFSKAFADRLEDMKG